MGLLDSNKVAMQTKTITITSKEVTVTGSYAYITSGLIDVRGYNTATIETTSATAAKRIMSMGNNANNNPAEIQNIYSVYKKGFISTIDFTAARERNFVIDLSAIGYWGLVALDSGTYSVTIQLSNKSVDSALSKFLKSSIDTATGIIASKVIDVTDKVLNAAGYLTEGGFIDVSNYNTAVIRLETPTVASGVTANIVSWLNNKQSSSGFVTDKTHTYAVVANDKINRVEALSAEGLYFIDISHISWWALYSTTAGTFNVTITLLKESPVATLLMNYLDERAKVETTEVTFDGTAGTKYQAAIFERKYKTVCIEVGLTNDANPSELYLVLQKPNGTTIARQVMFNTGGEGCTCISKPGLYYADITGCSRFRILTDKANDGAGTMNITLLESEMPIDTKPIQVIWTKINSLTTSTRNTSVTISNPMFEKRLLVLFKFIRIEIKYTGTGTPSGKISCATSATSAYKEVGEINAVQDVTDWFMNPVGFDLRVKFDFAADFTPSADSTMEFTIYGMR